MSLTAEVLMKLYPEPVREESSMTRSMAERLAKAIGSHPAVETVELFGSVARVGKGDDIDLVVTAHGPPSRIFIESLALCHLDAYADGHDAYAHGEAKQKRFVLACRALPCLLGRIVSQSQGIDLQRVDMFVFPVDWREKARDIQKRLRTWDPDFVPRIAAYAECLYRK